VSKSRFVLEGLASFSVATVVANQAQAQQIAPSAQAATADRASPTPTSMPAAAAPTATPTATSESATTHPLAVAPAPSATPDNATATPTAPAAAAPEPGPSSYFRIDHDYAFGLQLWAGATHPLVEGIGLASDIYIAEVEDPLYRGATYSWYGEFDIGPAFTLGPLSITPMVGAGFDWGAKHTNLINGPQLYTIISLDKIYFESWIWTFLYSPFKEQPAPDQFHTRDWILYKLSDTLGIGPQIELWYNLKGRTINGVAYQSGITQLPIGGHVEIGYGTGNSLGVFVGYDASRTGRDTRGGNGAVGRFTFVHNF
jgi:hypothetical protein